MIFREGIRSKSLLVFCMIMFFLVVGIMPAYSATFRVNDFNDAVDADPGDGGCETAAGNRVCTLRAAIQEANALDGRDVVILKNGIYLLTIPGSQENLGATGDLDIRDDLVLKGKGAKKTFINGNRLDRVIHIATKAEVTIKDLTIQNGIAAADFASTRGAGGGIANMGGVVKIVRCTIANNVAQGTDRGYGGGIANLEGTTIIKDSLVSNNFAFSVGPGPTAGGGVYGAAASLVVKKSVISENQAAASGVIAYGGGLFASGVVEISGSSIAGNVALSDSTLAFGGGMYLAAPGATVANCGISGNRAVSSEDSALGGGVMAYANLAIKDSVISDNAAMGGSGGRGGGLFGLDTDSLIVSRSMLTRNAATNEGGGIYFAASGGILSIEQGSRITRNLAGSECGGICLKQGTVNVSSDSVVKHNSPDDKNF